MRRIILLSFLLCAFSYAAAAPVVIASTREIGAIAREIAGSVLDLRILASPGEDVHHVEIRPSHGLALRSADAVLVQGAAYDGWMETLAENSRQQGLRPGTARWFDASEGVSLIEKPTGKVDRSLGDVHPEGNPHYLLDPEIADGVADRLRAFLDRRFPDLKEKFAAGHASWKRKHALLLEEARKVREKRKGESFVGFHREWPYFARHLGMIDLGELEPLPGIPPNPGHLKRLATRMNDEGVRWILLREGQDLRAAKSLAERTRAKTVLLPGGVDADAKSRGWFEWHHRLLELMGNLP